MFEFQGKKIVKNENGEYEELVDKRDRSTIKMKGTKQAYLQGTNKNARGGE